MASPIDDPRYALARLRASQQASGISQGGSRGLVLGKTTSADAARLGASAANLMVTNPTLKDQIDRIRLGKPADGRGITGAIAGAGIGALKALDVFAMPGRAVVSGIREGIDLFDANPETKASVKDFVKQVKDPTFGVGKAFKIDTGNIWIDRGLGFIGDVALDPLTYATFGAGKFAGASGRLALAEKVLTTTGDNALATSVARLGRSAIKDAEILERVGANRTGVYFLGKRIKVGAKDQGWRLPLSGAIGELGDTALTKLRLAASDTKLGKYMQKLTTAPDMRAARIALARGEVTPDAGGLLIPLINSRNTQRAALGEALDLANVELKQLVDSETPQSLDLYRTTVHRLLENPAALETATPDEQRAFEVWRKFFADKENVVGNAWKEVDPETNWQGVQNYFPHQVSEDGLRFSQGDSLFADELRTTFGNDPFDTLGAFRSRKLREGDKFFGYKLKGDDLTVERLNQIAREYGKIDFDFFETDIVKVAQSYVNDFAHHMGLIARNKHLADTGVWKKMEDMRVFKTFVDSEGVEAAKQTVKRSVDDVSDALKGSKSALENLVAAVRERQGATVKALAAATEPVVTATEASGRLTAALEAVVDSRTELLQARQKFATLFGSPSDLKPGDVPGIGQAAIDYMSELDDRIASLKDEIEQLATDVVEPAALNFEAKQARLEIVLEQLEQTGRAIDAAEANMKRVAEFGNVLEENMERIISGKDIDSTFAQEIRNIQDIIGVRGKSAGTELKKVRQGMGVRGSFKSFVQRDVRSKRADSFWKRFNDVPEVKITQEAVEEGMTAAKVQEFTTKLFTESLSLTQVRTLGLHMLMTDSFVHGANIPEFLVPFRNTLMDALEKAKTADFAIKMDTQSVAKGNRTSALRTFESTWEPANLVATNISDEMSSMDDFLRIFSGGLTAGTKASEEMSPSFINNLSRRYPWLGVMFDEHMEGARLIESNQDLVDQIKLRRAELGEAYEAPSITVGQGATENVYSPRQVLELYPSKRAEARRIMYPAGIDFVATAKEDLKRAVMQYAMLSEVGTRFSALSNVLLPYGFIPSERMYSAITAAVAEKFMPAIDTRLAAIDQARSIVDNMRSAYAEAWSLERQVGNANRKVSIFDKGYKEFEVRSAGQVFKDVVQQFLDGPDGPILREAIGERLVTMDDPFDIWKGWKDASSATKQGSKFDARIASNNWYETKVKPWFEATFPDQPVSKKAASDKLKALYPSTSKAAGRNVRSAFSDDATPSMVSAWFDDILGGEVKVGTTPMNRMDVGRTLSEPIKIKKEGLLSIKTKKDRQFQRMLETMLDPNINIGVFLNDPTLAQSTPSLYARMLNNHADELQALLDKRLALGVEKQEQRLAEQALDFQIKEAQRNIQGLKRGPKTPRDQYPLAVTGEQPSTSARTVLGKYNEAMSTPDYMKARNDEEIVGALDQLAHLDLSVHADGFILRPAVTETLEDGSVVTTAPALYATILNKQTGQREIIKFSEAEWDSLYAGVPSETKIKKLRSDLTASRRDTARLRREREELLARRKTLQDTYDSIVRSRAGTEVALSPAAEKKFAKAVGDVDKRVKFLSEQIDINQKFNDEWLAELEAIANPEVRASALEKMRVLVNGSGDQPAFFTKEEISRFINFDSATQKALKDAQGRNAGQFLGGRQLGSRYVRGVGGDVANRKLRLQQAWQATPEYRYLNDVVKPLENDAHVIMYQQYANNIPLLRQQIAAARAKADQIDTRSKNIVSKIFGGEVTTRVFGEDQITNVVGEYERALGTLERGIESARGAGIDVAPIVGEFGGELGQGDIIGELRRIAGGLETARPAGSRIQMDDTARLAAEGERAALGAQREQDIANALEALSQAGTAGRELGAGRAMAREAAGKLEFARKVRASLETFLQSEREDLRLEIPELRKAYDDALLNQGKEEFSIIATYGSPEELRRVIAEGQPVVDALQSEIDSLNRLVADLPKIAQKKSGKNLKSAEKIREFNEEVQKWIFQNQDALRVLAENPDDPVAKAWAAASVAESRFLKAQLARSKADEALSAAKAGTIQEKVIKPWQQSYEKLAKKFAEEQGIEYKKLISLREFDLPSYGIEPEVYRFLKNAERIQTPKIARELSNFLGGYTRFFKAYATLSPGFHVRNAMSNTFMIFAGGADVRNMFDGLKLYKSMVDALANGRTIDDWVSTLPKNVQPRADVAARVTMAMGGGQITEALAGLPTGGGRLTDNIALRASRKVGKNVEGSGHFMMAYDSAVKDMDFNTAFARTKRFMFDYSDPTQLDLTVRTIIPFWTWMSRNLPLQIVNQWSNPKAYVAYKRFANNMENREDDTVIPGYIREQGGINLGGGMILSPDFGFNRLEQTIRELNQPRRLASYVNPALRVPFELMGNTKLYSGQQFRDKYIPVEGMFKALIPVLAASGQLEYNSQGQPMMTEKAMYGLMNLVPPISAAERLFPSTEQYQRGHSSRVASWFGLPLRELPPEAQGDELARRTRELAALRAKQRAIEEGK